MSREILAHLLICTGPACSLDKNRSGEPKAPIDAKGLVARWKELRLYRGIHLTLTGCLGQCNRANQATLLSSEHVIYLEHLDRTIDMDDLVNWALCCVREERLNPLPPSLANKSYKRLASLHEVS